MKKKALLASILLLCGYWLVLKTSVPLIIANKMDAIGELGYDVEYRLSTVGGFPFVTDWELSGLRITSNDSPTALMRFQLPDIQLHLSPINPARIRFSTEGVFSIEQISDETSLVSTGAIDRLEGRTLLLLSGGFDDVNVALALSNLVLPETHGLPLGNVIQSLIMTARSVGTLNIAGFPESLQSWVDDSGSIQIDGLNLVYGPIQVRAQGRMALDRSLQPLFAMEIATTGLYQAADLAVNNGVYSSLNRTEAHNFLDTLTLESARDASRILELSVKVEDQYIVAGEMRLAKLARVEW